MPLSILAGQKLLAVATFKNAGKAAGQFKAKAVVVGGQPFIADTGTSFEREPVFALLPGASRAMEWYIEQWAEGDPNRFPDRTLLDVEFTLTCIETNIPAVKHIDDALQHIALAVPPQVGYPELVITQPLSILEAYMTVRWVKVTSIAPVPPVIRYEIWTGSTKRGDVGPSENVFTMYGLQTNLGYKVFIKACNINGCSAGLWRILKTAQWAGAPGEYLTAPGEPFFVGSHADSAIKAWLEFAWTPITYTGATFWYEVLHGSDEPIVVNEPHCRIENLYPNSPFTIAVRAATILAKGPLSPSATLYTAAYIPQLTAPTNFHVGNITSTTATFTWTAPPEAFTHYIFYLDDLIHAIEFNVGKSLTSYNAMLQPSTTYKAKIRACAGEALGPWSSSLIFNMLVGKLLPPGPPVLGVKSDTAMSISWAPSPDHAQVVAYWVFANGQPSMNVGTATSATLTGLTPATDYRIAIAACDQSSYTISHCTSSGTVTMRTADAGAPPVNPPIPGLTLASFTPATVYPGGEIICYVTFRNDGSTEGEFQVTVRLRLLGSTTVVGDYWSLAMGGLSAAWKGRLVQGEERGETFHGTNFSPNFSDGQKFDGFVEVKCTTTGAPVTKTYSSILTFRKSPPPTSPPSVPSLLVTQGTNSATLKCGASSGANYTEVGINGLGSQRLPAAGGSFTWTALTPGATYTAWAWAYNDAGWSNKVSKPFTNPDNQPHAPPLPTITNTQALDYSRIRIDWKSNGGDRFTVYCEDTITHITQSRSYTGVLTGEAMFAVFSGLVADTVHRVWIVACTTSGPCSASSTVNVRTEPWW